MASHQHLAFFLRFCHGLGPSSQIGVSLGLRSDTHSHARTLFSLTLFNLPLLVRYIARSLARSLRHPPVFRVLALG
jgi:hypothetical protein